MTDDLVKRLDAWAYEVIAPSLACDLVAARDRIQSLTADNGVLVEAGNRLSVAAQTSGGTAGRDEGLAAAIDGWRIALEQTGAEQ